MTYKQLIGGIEMVEVKVNKTEKLQGYIESTVYEAFLRNKADNERSESQATGMLVKKALIANGYLK